MDQYFSVARPSTLRAETNGKDKKRDTKFKPYNKPEPSERRKGKKRLLADDITLTSTQTTKLLLSTLGHEENPITNSDIRERSDHVVSCSSGHQVSEGRGMNQSRQYLEERGKKLSIQREEESTNDEPQVLRNVRAYINGFLSDTTDIEMKRIVLRAGGQILSTPSGATHILTSMQLNGSKTHKLLTTKSRSPVHVVRPEWVTDSIRAGKRLGERDYAILKDNTTKNLYDMWKK